MKLNILPTSGSVENLDLINANKADIGFVQAGIIAPNDNVEVESLASIITCYYILI